MSDVMFDLLLGAEVPTYEKSSASQLLARGCQKYASIRPSFD